MLFPWQIEWGLVELVGTFELCCIHLTHPFVELREYFPTNYKFQ